MHRLMLTAAIAWLTCTAQAETLPMGSAPPALVDPHFPDQVHAFVWRNWEAVNLDRMAAVLGATEAQVEEIGRSMGLPPHVAVPADHLARNYVCIIRRNWHLLPYEQLLTLLDWGADRLAFALREDDFLWVKLGYLKPSCSPLKYSPPDEATKQRCAEIRRFVQQNFGEELRQPAEPRFGFLDRFMKPVEIAPRAAATDRSGAPIRFLYSYFAVYGDPLMDARLDPYPDGLLQELAARGVTGVWLQTVLRQLAPSPSFPEFGKGWQTRLANLSKLVERADRFGIKVYLYMNEPRAMPASFFAKRADLKGVAEADHFAMCTSTPQVRMWLRDSLQHVFSHVPKLGGVFTISASENLTNCWSHYQGAQCPRCSKRSPAEVIAEVNATIAEGVRAGNPDAAVLVWDWGWQDAWAEDVIRRLPENVYLMSVSEWSLPIERGGVKSQVGEYSLSAVGPGPRAQRHWAAARQRGLKTMAKIQANCTWELSPLPYLPVMELVARHGAGLTRCHVDGMMLSWTLGGYPSPNLQLIEMFNQPQVPTVDDALTRLATQRYGEHAATQAVQAWKQFSRAFEEFPFSTGVIYGGPMQMGPANLLFAQPSGYGSTMVGFPYDDLDNWRSIYPRDVFVGQLEKVAGGWEKGIDQWRGVIAAAEGNEAAAYAKEDGRLAEAAWLHFRSACQQSRFIMARDALREAGDTKTRTAVRQQMRAMATEEMNVARRMFTLMREDSRIGFEASNQYNYMPLDLIEKCVNCDYILRHMAVEKTDARPFIEVDPAQTTALRERGAGKPFVAVGANYFDPETGWAPKLWQQFDEARVRQHLQLLHEQGFNTIRVFLTFSSFHAEPGRVSAEGEAKFRRLLDLCRPLGIYVIPSGPDHWEGTPEWRRGGDQYAGERLLDADDAWWRAFAGRFKDEPLILAYDLYNEPTVGWDSAAMQEKWNAWLKDRYGTVEKIAAAWSMPAGQIGVLGSIAVPPKEPKRDDVRLYDYQQFREHIGHEWTRRHVEAIRSVDSNHLVTIGHIQWAASILLPSVWHYAGFNLGDNAKLLDFVTIHFYPLDSPRPCDSEEGMPANRTYLAAVLRMASVGKPLMIGEFGWYGGGGLKINGGWSLPEEPVEHQVEWCQTLLDVSRGRVCGWLNWAFADTPTSTDVTRWSGLWATDLKLKPWGKVYGEFARKMKDGPLPPRAFGPWLRDYPFNQRSLITDPQMGNECRKALRALAATRPG